MSLEFADCPHCGARVARQADGVCPACRKDTRQVSALTAEESAQAARQRAWARYQELLSQNDADSRDRLFQSWDASQRQAADASIGTQPAAQPTPAQRYVEFQKALATFTPRVIATPAIVIVTVLIFVVMVATGVHVLSPTVQSMLDWGANFGPKTISGQWWRVVTSMFLHYGVLHLAFNMWVLWDLGRLVERLVGNVGFFALYFVSGIAGSLASLYWHPTTVSAGASGAVFGVAGALLGFIVLRRDTVPGVMLAHLRNSVGMFVLYNVVFGMTVPGIDMAAHVGGLIAGFFCGLVLSQPLSSETVARRRPRNAALVAIAAVALPLAACCLPAAPPDIETQYRRFVEMQSRVLDTANSLADRLQRGAISEADMADALARDVIPPWAECREQFEKMLDLPYVDQPALALLVEYMNRREESWRLEVEGIREKNPAKLKLADEKSAQADALAEEMTRKKPPR
jgi:rhomboid protease GluP